jgi:hypothetical protein
MLQARKVLLSLNRAYLKEAVRDYMLYFNRECLDRLLIQIKLDIYGFFHLRDPERSLFETLMLTGPTNAHSDLKSAVGFLCQLIINNLNPLVVGHAVDKRVLNFCIRILKNALSAGFLSLNDYLKFYTGAIQELHSEDNVHSRDIFYLLSSLRVENASPLALAIKYFPSHLIRPIFLAINDAYFTHNSFDREVYYRLLTMTDYYGLTPLHYAIRGFYPTALIDLYAAMSLILTRDEHIHFHLQNLSDNNYLDWIGFYGTLEKLKGYIHFLTENLQKNEVRNIIDKQACTYHSMRIHYDHDTEMSQALIHLFQPRMHTEKPTRTIYKFKLFSFPQFSCDGLNSGYENDIKMQIRQRLNP